MATTPLMGITIPVENDDPFIGAVTQTWAGIDSWLQAMRENDELIVRSDGSPWSVDHITNIVTWSTDIHLVTPDSAASAIIIPPGSAPLNDGSFLFTTVPARPISGVVSPAVAQATSVPRSKMVVILGYREGKTFYKRRSA